MSPLIPESGAVYENDADHLGNDNCGSKLRLQEKGKKKKKKKKKIETISYCGRSGFEMTWLPHCAKGIVYS
jgi:hypothetical protein